MFLELLTNLKKQKKNVGQLIPQIEAIIQKNNIQIDYDDTLEKLVDNFILSYLKVIKKLDLEEESQIIVETLIEEIIQKVESNNSLIPIMQKKIVQISNYCEENKKKPKAKITMKV